MGRLNLKLLAALIFYGAVSLNCAANPIHDREAGFKAAEQGEYDQAYQHWKKAADSGDSTAEFNLGVMFDQGLGRSEDISQAIYWYQRASNNGVAQADHNLGNLFLQGRGVSVDLKEAKRRFTRAADSGYAPAQYNLGNLLEKSDTAQLEKAFDWYKKAAEQNQVEAMIKLAQAYSEGRGVEKDRDQAITWYEKVREKTDAIKPQRELALLYLEDDQNYLKGQLLLRNAAERGDAESQYQLGLLYGQGRGVIQDYGQATFWYERAAKQQIAEAQYLLCLSYSLGKGRVVDILRAHVWCEAAERNGAEGAKEALVTIKESMSEHELLTAKKLAPMLNPK